VKDKTTYPFAGSEIKASPRVAQGIRPPFSVVRTSYVDLNAWR